MKGDAAWFQFLAIMDCRECGPTKGRAWRKADVVVTVEPCPKHRRMLDQQGWR